MLPKFNLKKLITKCVNCIGFNFENNENGNHLSKGMLIINNKVTLCTPKIIHYHPASPVLRYHLGA